MEWYHVIIIFLFIVIVIKVTKRSDKKKMVDSHELHEKTELKRYEIAKECKHFAVDKKSAPCLWHKSYCLHPKTPDPLEIGRYEHCGLVWTGKCDFGVIK